MGKLVKRAELTVLGTLGILLFSYQHLPALLSSMDDVTTTSPAAYSAAAYEAVGTSASAPTPDTSVSATPVTITTSSSTEMGTSSAASEISPSPETTANTDTVPAGANQ